MYSTIDQVLQFLQSRTGFGIKPGLERMFYMLEQVDNPEQRLKTIHIAGTNGKGSTLTFMKESLIQNGYVVGSFTSPSISSFQDQIKINHQEIADYSLITITNKLLPIINQMDQQGDSPTEFEITVVIALLYFVDSVDIALIETGMGGKLDSTNCVIPLLTIITNVGMDHVAFLGNTYEEIATHKAGIIKTNTPIITGRMNQESLTVIETIARNQNAPMFRIDHEYHYSTNDGSISFTHSNISLNDIRLSMKGEHQSTNAATAIMGLLKLQELGCSLDQEKTLVGLEEAFIPGRFEQVNSYPIVIIDGAHNKEGFEAFIQTINKLYPTNERQLLFAAFKDKPLKEMIKQIGNNFDSVTFTTFDHERASTVDQLIEATNELDIEVNPNWQQVINSFLNENSERKILFISGSIYFIRIVRKYFENLR